MNLSTKLQLLAGLVASAACLLIPAAGASAIVGGHPAAQRFQANADIVIDDQFFCGGTLIAPTKVLTAAHCVWNTEAAKPIPDSNPAHYDVVLGATNDDIFGSAAVRANLAHYKVTKVSWDPKWDPKSIRL